MNMVSLFNLPRLALRGPSALLRTAATALHVLADVNQHLADALAAQPPAPAPTTTPAPTRATRAQAPAATAPAPAAPADPPQDIPALAARTAPQVIAVLDTLSIEQLAELHEHESRNRRRRSVLRAIDAAAAPPEQARDEGDVLDDPREPDELVYSTSTPRR